MFGVFFLEQNARLYCRDWPAAAELGTKGQKFVLFHMLVHTAGKSIKQQTMNNFSGAVQYLVFTPRNQSRIL